MSSMGDSMDAAAESVAIAAEDAGRNLLSVWPPPRRTLRMLRAAGETTAVGFWISLLPLSLVTTGMLLTQDAISRRLRLPFHLGKWLIILYVIWASVIDKNITHRGGRPVHVLRRNRIWQGFRSYFRACVVYDFDEDEAVFADRPHIIG